MGTSSNLSSIIRYYAEKQNSPFIDFKEFSIWIKKYAEKKVEEQAELVKYLGDPSGTLTAELQGLAEKHIAAVIENNNKKVIVSIAFLSLKYSERYKEIAKDFTVPYLTEFDLPKKIPFEILERKKAQDYVTECIQNQNTKTQTVYFLEFLREVPAMVIPSSVPIQKLIEISQAKILRMMRKEDYHDYLLKKIRSSNPTREISIKHFFTTYINPEFSGFYDFTNDDDYYLWNQLCYLLRVDFEKLQDRTIEDYNVLQSIQISEAYNSYLKEQMQVAKRRENALKALKTNLEQSPFFYSSNQILKFHDESGRLLYGQYSEEDLKDFLQKETTEAEEKRLPELLVFKVESGTKYYVYKANVISLVVRLCNEAHGTIESILIDEWYRAMLDYEKLPEMNDDAKFEQRLENLVEEKSPVLYSLLNANFMSFLAYEKYNDEALQTFQIFADDKLLPYTDLLMLKRTNILSESKAKLPFIFSLPILSWIIGLFKNKKKDKAKESTAVVVKNPFDEEESTSEHKQGQTRQQSLAEQAVKVAKEMIPEGSTLDRELNYLNKQWNKLITKEASMNLTEDVNSLIRDYTRKVCRTISASSFTKTRIESLAETLVKTPNLQKIGEEKALKEYIELYMLRLVSNSR